MHSISPANDDVPLSLKPQVEIVATTAGRIVRERKKLRRASRFLIRTLFAWRRSVDWLMFLETAPLKDLSDGAKVRLVEKIHRPYVSSTVRGDVRITLLKNHYRIVARTISQAALADLMSYKVVLLSHIIGRDGTLFTLTLQNDQRFSHEGELTLALRNEALSAPLAHLTLTIGRRASGSRFVQIGGMQGPRPPIGKTEVSSATKNLRGLWPKRVVVEAAYVVASWIGAREILTTGRENHAAAKTYPFSRVRIPVEYDQFWFDLGGVRRPDGDFALPAQLVRRAVGQVAPKRRKQWLARQALLNTITDNARSSLTALTISPAEPTAAPVAIVGNAKRALTASVSATR